VGWRRRKRNCEAVSVVPKPVQKPHPPIFQPFASSERSIRWCATEGVTAVLPPLHPKLESQLCDIYAEVSGKPRGEGMGVLRDVVIADTDEEAKQLWRDSGYFCGHHWFESFGFSQGLTDPATGKEADLFADGLAFRRHRRYGHAPIGNDGEAAAGAMDLRMDFTTACFRTIG